MENFRPLPLVSGYFLKMEIFFSNFERASLIGHTLYDLLHHRVFVRTHENDKPAFSKNSTLLVPERAVWSVGQN